MNSIRLEKLKLLKLWTFLKQLKAFENLLFLQWLAGLIELVRADELSLCTVLGSLASSSGCEIIVDD